jgi:hypothetical protein
MVEMLHFVQHDLPNYVNVNSNFQGDLRKILCGQTEIYPSNAVSQFIIFYRTNRIAHIRRHLTLKRSQKKTIMEFILI